MPQLDTPHKNTRVTLTAFHNRTGELVDLALRGKVIVTKHGRSHVTLAESAYIEKIEDIARGNIIRALDLQVVASKDMPAELRAAILATQPTEEEIASGQWND